MAFSQNDLRALAYRVRTPRDYTMVRSELTAEKYGVDWCLTDILRLEYEARAPLLDAIVGLSAGRMTSVVRPHISVTIRSADGQPWSFDKVLPDGPAPANRTDMQGVAHHLPSQWTSQTFSYPAVFTVPIVSNDFRQSAVWLLRQHGWYCKGGGADRLRWQYRDSKSGDKWKIVEDAFCILHPDLSPFNKAPVMAPTPIGQTPIEVEPPKRGPGRPKKSITEATT